MSLSRSSVDADHILVPDISILLIAYNTRDLIQRCLTTVEENKGDVSLEIIVADNHPGDGTKEMLAEEFPQVRYFDTGGNLGFARGVNFAATKATAGYLLLLNPDTEVKPGTFEALLELADRRPDGGLYGGRTLNEHGELDPGSCWGETTLWSLTCFATGLSAAFKDSMRFNPEELPGWQRDTEREVGYITGCLELVSRKVWDELGGFDEDFWMYGEDADLARRARELGYNPMITPDAEIIHYVGASSPNRAHKVILRLTGDVTAVRKGWTGWRQRYAVAALQAGAALRGLTYEFLARATGGRKSSGRYWYEVWSRRDEWLKGWEPAATRAVEAHRSGNESTPKAA